MDQRRLDEISEKVIGCAIEVHRHLGPGLLESVYEAALAIELGSAGLMVERQKALAVSYKGHPVGEFRIDMLVEGAMVVELKSVERMEPVFSAQLLSYLKLGGYRLGLLINFNSRMVKDGIKRVILSDPQEGSPP
jgi:GxxExxY protein